MKLGVSAEFVRPGLVGGTEQALGYLLDGIDGVVTDQDQVEVVGGSSLAGNYTNLVFRAPPRRYGLRFLQESATLRSIGDELDVCFFPNYFTPPVPCQCRTITTIPDLQFRHLPEHFSQKKRLWQRWAHGSTLRRADLVTVYSDWVRADVLEHHGDRYDAKLRVLRIPVSWDRFGSSEAPSNHRPYVLSVASHYQHKNLATLVRAFRAVHAEFPDVELVLAGQLGQNLLGVRHAENIESLIDQTGMNGVVRATGYVSERELGSLYRNAELFAFPSLFEGFGLPPVEALGFGLPVVTTRSTSLPEVTMGMARYVDDPHDVEELSAAILDELIRPSRPSEADVQVIRERYAPRAIATEFLELAHQLS